MSLAHANWLAILVGTILLVALGATWFGPKTLYPVWWKAIGKEPSEQPSNDQPMWLTFSSLFFAMAIQVLALAAILGGFSHHSLGTGLLTGAGVGIGIAAASSLPHRLFGNQGWFVWVLESGPDLINLAIVGALLGAWH